MKKLAIVFIALLFAACAKEEATPVVTYSGPLYKYRVEAGVKYVGHPFNTTVYTNHLKHISGDCYEVVAHREMPDIYVKAGDTITLCKVLLIKKQ